MEKVETYVRFANESEYYSKISFNPNNLKDIKVLNDEVFATIDNIRIAIPRIEWEKIYNIKEKKDV
jgi:hypothetical protein